MKLFIVRLFTVLLPVVMILIGWEILMRHAPHAFSYKRNVIMENCRKNGKILVLGSSHSYFGVKTDAIPNAYNLAFVSQDLVYDRFIFETFLSEPNQLEYVIVPISIFSFFDSIEDLEPWRKGLYVRYWKYPTDQILEKFFILDNLPLQLEQFKKMRKRIKRKGLLQAIDISPTGWGDDQMTLPRNEVFAQRAKISATRHCSRNLQRISGFYETEKLIALAQKNKIKVILFTPPAHKLYYDNLNPEQEKKMRELLAKLQQSPGVYYLDLLRSELFSESDFGDADHLSEQGAEKLARTLYDFALKTPAI